VARSIRKHLAEKKIGASAAGFRWRGGTEISRLEGFSDAVFAFAVTLLVVSLEVPRTFQDLKLTMSGFFAFGICFALLFTIWFQQYVFFRRYGLEDLTVISLNGLLLFVVLFYVYPLKFLFTYLVSQLLRLPLGPTIRSDEEMAELMRIFSAGYIAVFLIFAILYGHAYRRRRELELNDLERFDTRQSVWESITQTAVGLVSLVIGASGIHHAGSWAGITYFALGPIKTAEGAIWGRRRRSLERAAS
jgi:transmembrane protein TMEM174 (potassium channel)